MYKVKTSYYYLEKGFPENLEPAFTNQSTRRKRFLVERKKKMIKRIIRKGLRTLVKPFFSPPTKKGVLLERSEDFFQDVVAQVKEENLQKKDFAFSRGLSLLSQGKRSEKIVGHIPAEDSFEAPLYSPLCKENQQDSPNEFRGKGFLRAPTKNKRNPVEKNKEALFLQGKRSKKEIYSLRSKKDGKQRKWRRYKFLFPLHRLKGELSKRESQYGKIELYKKQIEERKKLSFVYGTISKNSMKKLVKQAYTVSSSKNPPAKALVTLLESRLDVALFRASFFTSISMARQWISHNKVTVNKNKIRVPSYQLKGGDCIEISPTYAPFVKEKIRQRITKILPFRRSRKKVITPSLIENWCSFEGLLPKENPSLLYFAEQASLGSFSVKKNQENPFFFDSIRKDQKQKKGCSQNFSIKGEKIWVNPTLMQNFSSIRNHLQSIWEKTLCSQGGLLKKVGGKRGENKNHFYQTLSSFLRTDSSSMAPNFQENWKSPQSFLKNQHFALQNVATRKLAENFSSPFSWNALAARRSEKINSGEILDKTSQKARASTSKINGNSTKMSLLLQKGVILFGRLKKKEMSTLDFLNAKKVLIQHRNRAQKLAGLQVSPIKPLHLEVSYRLLTFIFLYSPQKVAYSSNLDFSLIVRSFK